MYVEWVKAKASFATLRRAEREGSAVWW